MCFISPGGAKRGEETRGPTDWEKREGERGNGEEAREGNKREMRGRINQPRRKMRAKGQVKKCREKKVKKRIMDEQNEIKHKEIRRK